MIDTKKERATKGTSQAIDLMLDAETPEKVIEALTIARPAYKLALPDDRDVEVIAHLAICKAIRYLFPRLCKNAEIRRVRWASGLVEIRYVLELCGWAKPIYLPPQDTAKTVEMVFRNPSKFLEVAKVEAGRLVLEAGKIEDPNDPWTEAVILEGA